MGGLYSMNTGCKLNIHKTFRRRPEFKSLVHKSLGPVSRGYQSKHTTDTVFSYNQEFIVIIWPVNTLVYW